MRKLLLILLVSFAATLQSQVSQDTCTGFYQSVIHGDSTNRIPCKIMVLMNPETYADYYHSKKKLNELRKEFPKYKSLIDSLMIVNEQQRVITDSVIALYKSNNEIITQMNVECKEKNIKLAQQVKRYKSSAIVGVSLSVLLFILLL